MSILSISRSRVKFSSSAVPGYGYTKLHIHQGMNSGTIRVFLPKIHHAGYCWQPCGVVSLLGIPWILRVSIPRSPRSRNVPSQNFIQPVDFSIHSSVQLWKYLRTRSSWRLSKSFAKRWKARSTQAGATSMQTTLCPGQQLFVSTTIVLLFPLHHLQETRNFTLPCLSHHRRNLFFYIGAFLYLF